MPSSNWRLCACGEPIPAGYDQCAPCYKAESEAAKAAMQAIIADQRARQHENDADWQAPTRFDDGPRPPINGRASAITFVITAVFLAVVIAHLAHLV
jgi:hypothetical protein